MKRSSARIWVVAAILSTAILAGCARQPSQNTRNSAYFGLSGKAIPQPDMNIMRDQAAVASQLGVNH